MRGLQRGAQSFSARTALAALEITTRIIHLLQVGFMNISENQFFNLNQLLYERSNVSFIYF